MTEQRDLRDDLDRCIEARRKYLGEHAAYWNRKRIAFFAVLGLVVLPLAVLGFFTVLFMIYAIFYEPSIGLWSGPSSSSGQRG